MRIVHTNPDQAADSSIYQPSPSYKPLTGVWMCFLRGSRWKGGRKWSLSAERLALHKHQHLGNDHKDHPPRLLLQAVPTHAMITLAAVDFVGAASLHRDVVRTATALMAVPSRRPCGRSLFNARPWRSSITQ